MLPKILGNFVLIISFILEKKRRSQIVFLQERNLQKQQDLDNISLQ